MAEMRRALLSFYRRSRRDLPWRKTRDPYVVWISEVMLQQTQVATVVPRFEKFLRGFPDLTSLARADETAVCEAWAGLGYYRRARHLHRAARVVVDQLDGRIPREKQELRRLPGIGDYTAAAIASIAFGERHAAVDGNLVRVLARIFALAGRASDAALVASVREWAERLVDCDRPGEVNQALMDVGATLCRPASPACTACPLVRFCLARRQGRATAYPGKKRKARRGILHVAFGFVERGRELLLEQRPLDGRWAGLWELPSASGPRARRDLGLRLGQEPGPLLARITHDLTHLRVHASVYRAAARKSSRRRWWSDPLGAPLSSLARKAILAVRDDTTKNAASPRQPRTRVVDPR